MISSSIRMVQRKLGINILLSLIIGITLFLGIVCVSTYDKIIEKVEPYKNILKMRGGVYYFEPGDFEIFLEQSEVRPDKICGVKESIIGTDNGSFHLLAYDENQGSYKIPLSEGVWYTEAEKSDCVNVVVTPNDLFKLGDIVHPADYMPDADKNLYLRICGVTADSFSYFDMHNHPEEGIQQLYDSYYVDSPLRGSLMFMSVDDIDQYEGFLYRPFLILGFDNKKSEEYVDNHAFTYAKQLEICNLCDEKRASRDT